MEVLVFRTSVKHEQEVSRVRSLLTIPAIDKWNFDLEDCDRILRVISDQVSPRYVESALNSAGFLCQELED